MNTWVHTASDWVSFDNVLSLEAVAPIATSFLNRVLLRMADFLRDVLLAPRYYLGGKISADIRFYGIGLKLCGKISYGFPVFKRLNRRFLNFTFTKLHARSLQKRSRGQF